MLDRREFFKVISSLAAGLHLPVFSKNADLNKSDKIWRSATNTRFR